MRSVIAAAVSLLCAKDNEEDVETKAELNRSRDENPETEYGQRMGDIANIVLAKVIELLTEDQHERFSRKRIIRTPETKVCETSFELHVPTYPHKTNAFFPALAGCHCLLTGQAPLAR